MEWIIFGAVFLGVPLLLFAVYRAGKNAGRVEMLQREARESKD
ncbi:MAG: hypothetical protein AB7K52_08195 [Phycisphaerales bacterium]